MSDGCRCEYLSEECGGADVVCQHCHDLARTEIRRLRDALAIIAAYDKTSKHGNGCCDYGCDCPHIAQQALANTKRLRTDDPPRGGSTQDALVGGDS